jgi:hypothetical protein
MRTFVVHGSIVPVKDMLKMLIFINEYFISLSSSKEINNELQEGINFYKNCKDKVIFINSDNMVKYMDFKKNFFKFYARLFKPLFYECSFILFQ